MAKVDRKAERSVTEAKGRLTTGDAPAHERRKGLANPIEDCALMIETMMNNWPREYELGTSHPIHKLIRQMRTTAAELVAPPGDDHDDVMDLI